MSSGAGRRMIWLVLDASKGVPALCARVANVMETGLP